MSHIELHDHVSLTITSIDSTLLDDLEAEFPTVDDPSVGPEYDGPNRVSDSPDLNGNEERLSARVTFVDDQSGATGLYDRLTTHSLDGTYDIRHYLSPVGGVLAEDLRAYYEENPTEQPTDSDGESYIPSSWDPSNHTISEKHN